MSDIESKISRLTAAVERMLERLDAPPAEDVILTREQAAKQLKVSVRQLRRLVAAGRLAALPSGIARAELERYAKAPVVPLPKSMTKPQAERTARDEAQRAREMLKAQVRAERARK